MGRRTRQAASLAAIFALAIGAAAPFSSVAVAQANNATSDCVKLGGAFFTNFIAQDQTSGVATGDLKGALGVKIITMTGEFANGKPVVAKVSHSWVTETGDTFLLDPAEVTFYPCASPSRPLMYGAVYEQGLKIVGGTGKFEGATGSMKVWGVGDVDAGQVAGRYAATICFKVPIPPVVAASSVQDGQFRLQVQSSGARELTAETSANLKDWEKLATKAPMNGAAEFNDPTTQPQRFYRVQAQ